MNGTFVLGDVMRKNGCKNIIFSSSATVYGDPAIIPITEECPKGKCTNPYGQTKSMLEEVLMDVQKADNEWNVVLLRYFNPIGAHKSGSIGENPNGIPNNLMPYITQTAVNLVLKGAKLIGANSDVSGPIENGIAPACKALVAPIEMATGKQAYFCGKPNPLMMRTGLRLLGCHSEEAVIIGDRMDTDILADLVFHKNTLVFQLPFLLVQLKLYRQVQFHFQLVLIHLN